MEWERECTEGYEDKKKAFINSIYIVNRLNLTVDAKIQWRNEIIKTHMKSFISLLTILGTK